MHFPTRLMARKIQRQKILTAGLTWKRTGFLPKLGTAFLRFCLQFRYQMPHFLSSLAAPASRGKYRTKMSLNCSAEQFCATASKGKKYFTHYFESISFAAQNVPSEVASQAGLDPFG